MSDNSDRNESKRAVVALLEQNEKVLVIQRSEFVVAPGKICFPGGHLEPGETVEMALVREMQEELGLDVEPVKQVWHSHSTWGIELFWWQANHLADQEIRWDPQEVAWARWMSWQEFRQSDDLLSSNMEFLDAMAAGEILL